MAEVIGGVKKVGDYGDVYEQIVRNEDVTIKTSTTTLISQINASQFRDFTLELFNDHVSSTVTAKVWMSNRASPGTAGGTGWQQVGDDITLSADSGEPWAWKTMRAKWLCVTATADAQTTTDNDANLRMSN